MKKPIIFILSILLVFALVACQADTELIGRIITYDDFLNEITKRIDLNEYTLEETSSEHSQNYTYTSKTDCEIEEVNSNFEMEIDGIKFSLPITTEEFVGLGFELSYIDTDSETVDLNTDIDFKAFNATSPKGNTFSVFSASKDGSMTPIKDSIVMQVSFYEENFNYGDEDQSDTVEIKFFGNITEKSSVDSIIKELKTPRQIDFLTTQYKDQSTSTKMRFDFHFSNEIYLGSFTVTTNPVKDESIESTSYISYFSYLIDYESIKNS